MTIQTFTWCPQTEPQGSHQFRVLTAQFGDGYKQTAGDGIHTEVRTWSLQFTGNAQAITPIRDFLRNHQGWQPFYWTPPMEATPLLFDAPEFTLTPLGGGMFTLVVSFQERAAP